MTDSPTLTKARVQQWHTERARKLEMIRRMEWDVTREDKINEATVLTLRGLRNQVSDLEDLILAGVVMGRIFDLAKSQTPMSEEGQAALREAGLT